MSKKNLGVHKVNENIFKIGRSLIYTEQDLNNIDYAQVPDGSLWVNTTTGEIRIKLAGSSAWSKIPVQGSYEAVDTKQFEKALSELSSSITAATADLNALASKSDAHVKDASKVKQDLQELQDSIKLIKMDVQEQLFTMENRIGSLRDLILNEPVKVINEDFSLDPGDFYSYAPNGINFMNYDIKLLVYDSKQDSLTYNNYIDAMAVGYMRISPDNITVGNDADERLKFRIQMTTKRERRY